MVWFNSIEEVKKFLGKDIDASVTVESFSVYIDTIYQEHLAFWIPIELYNYLLTLTDTNVTSTDEEKKALSMLQGCLAWFSAFYSAKNTLRLNDNGLIRHETESTKSGFKYQEQASREHYENMAFARLEMLLIFLDKNVSAFTTYENTVEHKRQYASFLKNATLFSEFSAKKISRGTFEHLYGVLIDIEDSVLSQFLPTSFYTSIKARYFTGTLTSFEKEFLKFIMKGVAALVLEEATIQNIIQFQGNTVFVKEYDFNDNTTQQSVKADVHDAFRLQQRIKSERNLMKAKGFAFNNKDSFKQLLFAPPTGSNESSDAWVLPSDVKAQETSCTCEPIAKNTKIVVL